MDRKGAALIFVFVILVGLSGVVLAFLAMTNDEVKAAGTGLWNMQAFYIAEAGLAKARWALTEGGETIGWGQSDIAFGEGTYTVTTVDNGDDTYTITSEGYVPDDANPLAKRQVVEEAIPLAGGASGENLAEDKDITASSQASGRPASRANDGNRNTYWQSDNGGSAWLRIDFGEATELGYAIYYEEEGSNIADYTIEYSPDDTGWTVVPDLSKNASAATFTPTSARYFRLRVTSSGSTDVAIEELRMYEGGLGQGEFSTSW